ASARLRALLRAGTAAGQVPGGQAGGAHALGGHARPRYSPVRVSTLIFSPVVMNNGTWIWTPVCSVAGLVPPVDRSPWTPGSVWLTVSSTAAGSSTYSGFPSLNATVTVWSSSR